MSSSVPHTTHEEAMRDVEQSQKALATVSAALHVHIFHRDRNVGWMYCELYAKDSDDRG